MILIRLMSPLTISVQPERTSVSEFDCDSLHYLKQSACTAESAATRELINARKTSHKHNRLHIWVAYGNSTSLRYLVFTSMPGESYVTVGDSGLCCCVCVTSLERELTPSFVDCLHCCSLTCIIFVCEFLSLFAWLEISVLIQRQSGVNKHNCIGIRFECN